MKISPVTVGALVVVALAAGVGLYVSRSGARPEPSGTVTQETPPPVAADPAAPAVARRLPTASNPGAASNLPALPDPAGDPMGRDTSGRLRQLHLDPHVVVTLAEQYMLTQRADEVAFKTLSLDEATIAAIRKINRMHGVRRRAVVVASMDAGVPANGPDPEEQARRSELDQLLGPAPAKRFIEAEESARRDLLPKGQHPRSPGESPAQK